MFESTKHTDAPSATIRRRVRLLGGLVAGGAAMLLLAGCAGSPGAPSDDTAPADPTAVAGTWGDPDEPGTPSLVLAEDGTLTGTDGCNRLTGTWELDDGTIDFGDLAATRMFCEGVDDWLSRADEATVSGTTMTVYGDGHRKIGTLERSE